MSDIREEWFKLVLDELRKNNDKVDNIKSEVNVKIDELEDRLAEKMEKSSEQHITIFKGQERIAIEHARMNDMLQEHMRRTLASEQRLDILTDSTKPIIKQFLAEKAIEEHGTKSLKRTTAILGAISVVIGVVISLIKAFNLF